MPAVTEILKKTQAEDHNVDPDRPQTLNDVGLPEPSHLVWLAFGDLLTYSWFFRLSTLQEVVVLEKSQIVCGSKMMDLATLDDFADAMKYAFISRWTVSGVSDVVAGGPDGYGALGMISDLSAAAPAGTTPQVSGNSHTGERGH